MQPYEKELQKHAKRRAQIQSWYKAGRSPRSIATQEGISVQRVYQIINGKRNGGKK